MPMVEKQIFILTRVSSAVFPVVYTILDINRMTILIISLRSSTQPIHYFLPWLKCSWIGQWIPDKRISKPCVLKFDPERKECLNHEQQIWMAGH